MSSHPGGGLTHRRGPVDPRPGLQIPIMKNGLSDITVGAGVPGRRFPFRLGTTSYILPADLTTNARSLAEQVQDVELVLFETEEASNLPHEETLHTLQNIARDAGLSYTVHFPLSVCLGSRDPSVREQSIQTCLRVYNLCQPLAPFAYILHFHGEQRGPMPSPDLDRWLEATANSLGRLLDSGLSSRLLCVETLDYPFHLIESIVKDFDLSICLDVGHILLNGHPLEQYLDQYLGRSRVVHLHGIYDGVDHKDIAAIPSRQLNLLFSRLSIGVPPERVLTLEVFTWSDLRKSISVVERFFGPAPVVSDASQTAGRILFS